MTGENQATHAVGFINATQRRSDRPINSSQKYYRLKSAPAPLVIRDSRGIFELTKALKSADKALVVWTLRGWIAHNQSKKKAYRDGHHWTFSPLNTWQEKYFPWLSVKQLGTIMAQLVEKGVLIRTRRNVHCCYWYRVNESVLTALCASLPPAQSLISQTSELIYKTASLSDKTSDQSAETAEHKTVVKKQENLKQNNQKQPQTATTAPDEHDIETQVDPQTQIAVAAVAHPAPPRGEESGEHSIDGDAVQAKHDDHHGEPVLVKATTNGSTATAPLSKVPKKVLSATGDTLIAAMKEVYGEPLAEGHAANLIRQYGEDRVRGVHWYTASRMSEWLRPVAFMTAELRDNRLGLPSFGADDKNPYQSINDAPLHIYDLQPIDDDASLNIHVQGMDDEPSAPVIPGGDSPVSPRLTAIEAWGCAYKQISGIAASVFEYHLKDAVLVSYEPQTQTYTVAVRTTRDAEMLQHRYHRLIERCLNGLTNGRASLVFVDRAAGQTLISNPQLEYA